MSIKATKPDFALGVVEYLCAIAANTFAVYQSADFGAKVFYGQLGFDQNARLQ